MNAKYFKMEKTGNKYPKSLRFRVNLLERIIIHFSQYSEYLGATVQGGLKHVQDPIVEISTSELKFGRLDAAGGVNTKPTVGISLKKNYPQDFLIIFLPNSPDEIAVGHIPWATDQVRVLGRFDCNNLSDFDFVGFGGGQSSGQSRPTEWIVEQSRTAAPVAVFM